MYITCNTVSQNRYIKCMKLSLAIQLNLVLEWCSSGFISDVNNLRTWITTSTWLHNNNKFTMSTKHFEIVDTGIHSYNLQTVYKMTCSFPKNT